MDLLGSILGSMERPPKTVNTNQELLAKKQNEKFKKIQDEEKNQLKQFRESIEEKINKFMANDSLPKIELKTMDKMHRSIVHDVSEIAGLNAFSFGIEDVDRHTVVYKKEFTPSEDELNALRKGEDYDPEKLKLIKQLEIEEKNRKAVNDKDIVPNSNYRDKYEKLIGKDAGIGAAHIAQPNKQFGFVPSANKRDQRSIEQILADNKKKKQKTQDEK